MSQIDVLTTRKLTASSVRLLLTEMAINYSALLTLNHCSSKAELILSKETRELQKAFLHWILERIGTLFRAVD